MRRFLIALALIMAACTGGYGTLTLALKGKGAPPPPAASYAQQATNPSSAVTVRNVFVTLSRVEVHVVPPGGEDRSGPDDDSDHGTATTAEGGSAGEDESGWVTIPLATRQLDLMALQSDPAATLGQLHLPAGKITQIRLFLDPAGRNVVVLSDGTSCGIDLGAIPTTGIRITQPFKAINLPANEKVTIFVDLDLRAEQTSSGTCTYRIDPVIQIERVDVEDQKETEPGRGQDGGD